MPTKTRKRLSSGRGANGAIAPNNEQTSAPGAQRVQRSAQRSQAARRSPNWVLLGGAGLLLALFGLLLVFLALGPNVPPKPVTSTPGPASVSGRISFVRNSEEGKRDIYVVDPDGTRLERVTNNVFIEGLTAWSPDGRYIVAQITQDGVSTIARVTVGSDNKSGEVVALTSDVMLDDTDRKADSVIPVWSPDSQLIAFQSKKEGGNYQIYIMDKDGNNKRRLSTGTGVAIHPSWSPDGKSLAYVGGDSVDVGKPKEIYTLSLEGGAPRKLTALTKDLSKPIWSPDGKSLVYLDNLSDRYSDIMIMSADGASPRKLADGVRGSSPQFSPAGDKLLYYYVSLTPPSGSHVFIVPTSGGEAVNLSGASVDDYQPTWSPDATMLAWSSARPGSTGHKIVVANADGSAVKAVTQGNDDDYQPQWGAPPKP